ncbi:MAG: LysM peptidoglycan-binding domain-containing protein [Chitinophagales bacterium]|nr:LysM peptidoglycan-binding domain-containing protein [Chitinophagales bacterium]MDW8393896.1 LysM peptidoglycan-binding domain-containing protein [Chitinophagales bacterium]
MNRFFSGLALTLIHTLIIVISPATHAQLYDMNDVEAYIKTYRQLAIEEMERTGIPASIKLAQAIIESGAGKSTLAREANNHFGIKCHKEWDGKRYYYDDDQQNECFRRYASVRESYRDHSEFLRTRSRYAVLFSYDPRDYASWAKGLKACGYATNPRYAEVLIKCIEDYDLHQWDLSEKERDRWFASVNQMQHNGTSEANGAGNPGPAAALSLEERIGEHNEVKYIELRQGESLSELATALRISVHRLLRYNDVADPDQLPAGSRVYIQPKRNQGPVREHVVQAGETMFSIAQQHAMQLEKLYEKNKMILGTQPAAGEVLYLREHRPKPPALSEPDGISAGKGPLVPSAVVYTVQPGDTLYSIARRHQVTVDELMQYNQLRSAHLRPGMVLRIPGRQPQP